MREAASATAEEALDLGVIDAVADTPEAYLDAIDGMEVEVGGEMRSLRTAGAAIRPIPTSPAEDLLTLLANPALALILLTIGVNAILAELSNPGGYVAGIVGLLALSLGLYSLGALDANWIGLGFIAAAFLLFALDVSSPSMGVFTLGGLLLFVAGSVLLFSGGGYRIPWATIGGLALFSAAFFLFVVRAALATMRRRPSTGGESLVGARARLKRLPDGDAPGTVLVAGEHWDAVWDADVDPVGLGEPGSRPAPGHFVTIRAREGFVLTIAPE